MMVRVGAKRKVRHVLSQASKKKNAVLGKRDNNETTSDHQRSSKRARKTTMPYQTPESIDSVIKAISNCKGPSLTKAKNEKKISKEKDNSNTAATTPTRKRALPKSNAKKLLFHKQSAKLVTKSKQSKVAVIKTIKARKIGLKNKKPLKNKIEKAKTKRSKKAVITSTNDDDPQPISNLQKKRRSKKEALNPKPQVTLYEKDPTFHSNLEIPHISTLAHSRLIFRAILNKDLKLLRKLLTTDVSLIYSLCLPKSPMADRQDSLSYAIQIGNKEAVKLMLELAPEIQQKKLGASPDLLMQEISTGHGSRMMFGHGLRDVTVARGGKEGNAAFLKDAKDYNCYARIPQTIDIQAIVHGITKGMPYSSVEYFLSLQKDKNPLIMSSLLEYIDDAIRHGNIDVAGKLVEQGVKHGGYGFNFLHQEALTHKDEPFTNFKPVSVVKKCTLKSRFTPLHAASINPNEYYLQTLLNSKPEYGELDRQNWGPIHYAAVCSGDGPLKLLISRGVSTTAVEKGGNTPLHLAASRGRIKNVKVILDHELLENKSTPNDNQIPPIAAASSLEKPNKLGMRPLHVAVQEGHVEIVKVLLDSGADSEKFTPAQYEKLTPLMIACQYGHLEIVKLLINRGVKVAAVDRRGRTAIFHSVINGHAHVLSYLLRLGVNTEVTDSSGNSLAHYAAAYGWYFNLLLLLEAGCNVVKGNDWKLTPLAVAFMKGHIGIVELLVKQPGVEVNTPVDADSGMTLLLTGCASTSLKSSLIPRLKFLIEELKSDCTTPDFKGNNALHHLASHTLNEHSEEFTTLLKNLLEAAKYLFDHGCDSNAVNFKNQSPFMIACEVGNFWIAEKFIDWGLKLKLTIDDENGETVLHKIARFATCPNLRSVYEKLAKDPNNLQLLKKMAQLENKKGMTALSQVFCSSSSSSISEKEISNIQHFVTFLVKKLDSNVNAVAKDKKTQTSVLHAVIDKSYAIKILPILQASKNLEMDPIDNDQRTPLAKLIVGGNGNNIEVVQFLINAGANVNFKSSKDNGLGLLLLLASRQPRLFPIVPKMIEHGANFEEVDPETQNSVLHLVARNPKEPFALETIQSLVKAGANVNAINKEGRTPLHLVVNARGKETDVAYDIEDFLLSSGADLCIKDIRQRTALHYVFVKIGKPLDTNHLDPIELVMVLLDSVKGMKDLSQFINVADAFGRTPLHYAAMRGATICCSYFTSTLNGNLIDLEDDKGNTAFGLAVYGGHEASSLHFQQQGANFLHLLDTNIQVIVQQQIKSPMPFGRNNNTSDDDDSNMSESDSDADWNEKRNTEDPLSILVPDEENGFDGNKGKSTTGVNWTWEKIILNNKAENKLKIEEMTYPIIQEVVKKDFQGLLHLMIAKLQSSGGSLAIPIATSIKSQKLRLALKLIHRVKSAKELVLPNNETLLHTLAKYCCAANRDNDLQLEVSKSLVEKGLNPMQLDELASSPIIYAAMNRNLKLINKMTNDFGLSLQYLKTNVSSDNLGRTPFSALFWKLDEFVVDIPSVMLEFGASLITNGVSSPNVLTKFPFALSPFPCTRYLSKYHKDHNEFETYSPLIAAVIFGRYNIVSWLLKFKSQVDLNFADDKGRTALMHAVRLNDLRMVKVLLSPKSYNWELDKDPWSISYSNFTRGKSPTEIDVNARDHKGLTAVDHFIRPGIRESQNYYSYSNVEPILAILYKCGSNFTQKSGDENKSPLDRAFEWKQFHILDCMYKLLKTPQSEKKVFPNASPSSSTSLSLYITGDNNSIGNLPMIPFSEDAKKIALEKYTKNPRDNEILPDPLLEMDPDNSELVMDSIQGVPFDCLLTKVDLFYGMNGLYNFYKMQVVKEPRGKQLVLLFTQWGRVGDKGQFQKTPFPTEEEAVKEFKKIFKSKSGNSWDELNSFKPMPKKYRMVHKEMKTKRLAEIKVDFGKLMESENIKKSNLNTEIYALIKTLTMVHKMELDDRSNRYYHHSTALEVSDKLPIVSTEALQKADAVLNKIKEVLTQKAKMQQGLIEYMEEEKLKIFQELVNLSEEYYSLVPVYGYASEALEPIFEFHNLHERQEEIYRLVHLGFSKELILASEYNSRVTNPFDYIYKSLGTSLTVLDLSKESENFEAQLILQYIYASSPKTKVERICRIQKQHEKDAEVEGNNKWMLWHGSKSENILSILNRGLQIAPLGVDKMGDLFGKGIYLADTFVKSEGYSNSNYNHYRSHNVTSSSRFMFLCEAALGKIHPVRLYNLDVDPGTETTLPKGFDSSKTADSRFIPDPSATIVWNGKNIPLGTSVEQVFSSKNQSYGLDYNEYILFNPKQVKLRYLIQFK